MKKWWQFWKKLESEPSTIKSEGISIEKKADNPEDLGKEIFDSSHDGDLSAVKELIDRGADVNFRNEYYDNQTSLMVAAYKGHLNVVDLLIRNGADLECSTPENGFTALFYAAFYAHKNVVEKLLKNGANINHLNLGGETVLFRSAYDGHVEIVDILLRNGINKNVKDAFGNDALHYAESQGHSEIVNLLRGEKSKSEVLEISTTLEITSDFILKKNCDVCNKPSDPDSIKFSTAIFYICPQCEIVYCSDCWWNLYWELPNADIRFCPKCSTLIIRELPGKYGRGFYRISKEFPNVNNIFKNIISNDFNKFYALYQQLQSSIRAHDLANLSNDRGVSLLHHAADKMEIIEFLLSQGANPNLKTPKGFSALHMAISNNPDSLKISRLLLENGADVNMKSNYGYFPLWYAVEIARSKDITSLLLDYGADANLVVDDNQLTPLHAAARSNQDHIALELIKKGGADINAMSNDGKTPVYLAALNDSEEVLKILLDNDAAIDISTNDGEYPIDVAEAENIKKMLLKTT